VRSDSTQKKKKKNVKGIPISALQLASRARLPSASPVLACWPELLSSFPPRGQPGQQPFPFSPSLPLFFEAAEAVASVVDKLRPLPWDLCLPRGSAPQ